MNLSIVQYSRRVAAESIQFSQFNSESFWFFLKWISERILFIYDFDDLISLTQYDFTHLLGI